MNCESATLLAFVTGFIGSIGLLWRAMTLERRFRSAEGELARAERERRELARQQAADSQDRLQADERKKIDRSATQIADEPTEADADKLIERVQKGPK